MSSHREEVCKDKKHFTDRASARILLHRLVEQGEVKTQLQVYRCCEKGWAVGHKLGYSRREKGGY